MTRIQSSSPPAGTGSGRVSSADGRTELQVSGDSNQASLQGSQQLGESTRASGEVDVDAEGLRRAHVQLEHFFGQDDRYRLSAKVGTSQMSESLRGASLLSKVQLDKASTPLVGPLSHSFSVKAGAFHLPASGAVRSGVGPESVDLLGVGGRYDLQLDTRLGGDRGVQLTGNYGVAADLFIEPNPSAASRQAFSSGTGFGAFDIGKTAGFSDVTLRASTRAAYQIGDRAELSVRHDLQTTLDDPTVKSVVDEHALTGAVTGRVADGLQAGVSVRVPLEDRTRRPGEAPDGVRTQLDLSYQPSERLSVTAYGNLLDSRMGSAGVAAGYNVRDNVTIGGFADHDFVTHNTTAGVGVSIRFGGGSKPRRASSSQYLERQRREWDNPTRSDLSGSFTQRPASQRITSGQVGGLGDLKSMSYDEAMAAIDTPDKAAALLASGTYFEYGFHPDELAKYSPREAWSMRTGVVCAEQHAVQAQALKHNGYQAHNVQYLANGIAHVVTAYQDKQTGKWNILDYNNKIETQADTIQQAMQRYEPGYYEYKVLDYSDTTARTERPQVIEVDRSATVREVRRFWDD